MPLVDIIRLANQTASILKAEHVIIGGIAASAVGEPRATKDVDMVLLVPLQDAEYVVRAVESQGVDVSRRDEVLRKLSDGKPAKIVLGKKFSMDLRLAAYSIDVEAISRAVHATVMGEPVNVSPPEELIVYKLARFEPIDQHDIKSIILVQEDALDWIRIERLTNELSEQATKPEMLPRLEQIKTWR